MNSRQFMQNSFLATLAIGMPFSVASASDIKEQAAHLELLKIWCDRLISLQIFDKKESELYGGILSPLGSRIRGRSWEALYPMMVLYRETKDKKYLKSAIAMQEWSNHVSRADGSWVNEPTTNNWKGTTVFGLIALGLALKWHGDLLPIERQKKWLGRIPAAAAFLDKMLSFDIDNANINYPMSMPLALYLAGDLTNNPKYIERAAYFASRVKEFLTPNNLIIGEGKPYRLTSPRGCRHVDLGYNVEETLPNLILYAHLVQDKNLKNLCYKSLKAHSVFMLPDGAWDNSWGTRCDKWSWWGSRTSDGCQIGYAYFSNQDPVMGEIARRNFELYKKTTHNGILYGGPDYVEQGVSPSLHHTFCHVKTLAYLVDLNLGLPNGKNIIPREKEKGIYHLPEINVYRIALYPWMATLTVNDALYKKEATPTGGVLSQVYHQKIGPVLVSSTEVYHRYELDNMQPEESIENFGVLTARLIAKKGDVTFRQTFDFDTKVVEEKVESNRIIMKVAGKLRKEYGEVSEMNEPSFNIVYLFGENSLSLEIVVEHNTDLDDLYYTLPIVATKKEKVTQQGNGWKVMKLTGEISVSASEEIVIAGFHDRIFHFSPGFSAIPFQIPIKAGKPAKITLNIL